MRKNQVVVGIRLFVFLVIGLAFGMPLPVQTQSDTDRATPQAERLIHEVQAGETLSAIANLYGVPVAELMAYNGITDADAIYIGQQLNLPEGAVRQPDPTPLPTHEIQAGETLSEIAEQYNVALTRLMLFNGLRDANAIRIGQTLVIPPPRDEEVITPTSPSPQSTATATAPPPTAAAPTATSTVVAQSATTTESNTAQAFNSTTPVATTDRRNNSALNETTVAAQIASLNRTYTVATGDTFSRIALRTGVDQEALRQLNRLPADALDQIFVGQKLLLPATGNDLRVRQPQQEYVVKAGDSLGSIAIQFELTTADLLIANRIADPDSISIGQRLTIPQQQSAEAMLAGRTTSVGPTRNGFHYYTVQTGDTISELARAFQSTNLAILEYNNVPNEETVYAGLEIRIPFGPPSLPNLRPPVPASGTSFLVSLSRQQCWLFRGNRVAEAWTCSTGYGDWITRVGTFAVQSKIEMAESSAYRLDMPYWLGIYDVGPFENGIHGLPVDWDTGEKIWEGLIGEPATFGCAMLEDRDAAVLFETAYIGMPIHVIN